MIFFINQSKKSPMALKHFPKALPIALQHFCIALPIALQQRPIAEHTGLIHVS